MSAERKALLEELGRLQEEMGRLTGEVRRKRLVAHMPRFIEIEIERAELGRKMQRVQTELSGHKRPLLGTDPTRLLGILFRIATDAHDLVRGEDSVDEEEVLDSMEEALEQLDEIRPEWLVRK